MKEPYELNEEELSAISGGAAQPGERVVTIKVDQPGMKTSLTIRESDLGKWQERHPDKAGIAQYSYGTFMGHGQPIKYD